MKKNYSDKQISAGEGHNKGALVCLRECVIVGFGHWQAGDVISDPALIAQIADNPNFKLQEDK